MKLVHGAISAIISISTGTLRGSELVPTAERACVPLSLPKTLPSKSEHPLITSGCWLKSSTQLTNPTICCGGCGVAALLSIARNAGEDLDNARDLVEVAHVPPQRSHEYEPDPLRQLRGLLRRIVEANLARVQPARGHARSALRRVR